jgi:hypothetical protein
MQSGNVWQSEHRLRLHPMLRRHFPCCCRDGNDERRWKEASVQRYFAICLAMLISPAWADCLPANTPLTGALWRVETRHPAGHKIEGLVLFVGDGPCVAIDDYDGGTVETMVHVVHLVFADKDRPKDPDALMVEDVTVSGNLKAPITAWHLGDAVMFDARIVDGVVPGPAAPN